MLLTAEQKDVVRNIIKGIKVGNDQIQTLGGYAGTGKTTITTALHQYYPDFACCAFTGKAASVMRSKGMHGSRTIHKTIYYPDRDGDGKVTFRLKPKNQLSCSGFLVDEASMVGKEEYGNLLSYELPIVFIGDHGQLEPVGSDVNVMKNPMYKLETIHRNAGEIAFFAEHIRKGGDPWSFNTDSKVQMGYHRDATPEIMDGTDQMICAFNQSRVAYNNSIRHHRQYGAKVQVGDRIICLRNNWKDSVFNGMHGNVTAVNKNFISIETDDGDELENLCFHPEQFGQEKTLTDIDYHVNLFDFGYCITAHKSQGSEWQNVLVFEQICQKWDHVRWAYTAASRAKTNLIWLRPNPRRY